MPVWHHEANLAVMLFVVPSQISHDIFLTETRAGHFAPWQHTHNASQGVVRNSGTIRRRLGLLGNGMSVADATLGDRGGELLLTRPMSSIAARRLVFEKQRMQARTRKRRCMRTPTCARTRAHSHPLKQPYS